MEITFYRKLAYKLADIVVDNHEYSDSEVKRIRYGLVCIFSDLYKFILLLIIFSAFSLTNEFLLAFIGILILRPTVAGFHAKSEPMCLFISFTTMFISITVGKMNLIPSSLQVLLIILLPISGIIISPVRTKKVEEKTLGLKISAGIVTALIVIISFFFLTNQILLLSAIQIYMLALYQMLKNYKNSKIQ